MTILSDLVESDLFRVSEGNKIMNNFFKELQNIKIT
jgi:hypothetical protein